MAYSTNQSNFYHCWKFEIFMYGVNDEIIFIAVTAKIIIYFLLLAKYFFLLGEFHAAYFDYLQP